MLIHKIQEGVTIPNGISWDKGELSRKFSRKYRTMITLCFQVTIKDRILRFRVYILTCGWLTQILPGFRTYDTRKVAYRW